MTYTFYVNGHAVMASTAAEVLALIDAAHRKSGLGFGAVVPPDQGGRGAESAAGSEARSGTDPNRGSEPPVVPVKPRPSAPANVGPGSGREKAAVGSTPTVDARPARDVGSSPAPAPIKQAPGVAGPRQPDRSRGTTPASTGATRAGETPAPVITKRPTSLLCSKEAGGCGTVFPVRKDGPVPGLKGDYVACSPRCKAAMKRRARGAPVRRFVAQAGPTSEQKDAAAQLWRADEASVPRSTLDDLVGRKDWDIPETAGGFMARKRREAAELRSKGMAQKKGKAATP